MERFVKPAALIGVLALAVAPAAHGQLPRAAVVKHAVMGCATLADWTSLMDIQAVGDQDAANKLVNAGRCGGLPEGARVFIEDSVRVRRYSALRARLPGSLESVWVQAGAVR